MIMPRGEALLLPARTWFIVVTLLLGLLVNMLQNMGLWGNAAWTPDILAVVLVFWCRSEEHTSELQSLAYPRMPSSA